MKLEFESNTTSLPFVDQSEVDEMISDSNSPEVTKLLRDGIEAAQKGNRAEARTLLLRVTEADAKNENAWLWLASISEYPEELLVFLKNVLNINPNSERAIEWSKATQTLMAKTFVQRGIDATKNEQKDIAKQCFLQAIVHDGESELAWLWLASVSSSPEEKMSHLQKVLSINPHNDNAISSLKSAKNQMAKALLPKANQVALSGKREEAIKLLDEIVNDAPDFEDAWMLKAHLAESLEDKIGYFEQVLEVNSENQVAKANLESLKMFVGKAKEQEEITKGNNTETIVSEPQNLVAESAEEISSEESVEDVRFEEAVDLESAELEVAESLKEDFLEVEETEEKEKEEVKEVQQEFSEVDKQQEDSEESVQVLESDSQEIEKEVEIAEESSDEIQESQVHDESEMNDEAPISLEMEPEEIELEFDVEEDTLELEETNEFQFEEVNEDLGSDQTDFDSELPEVSDGDNYETESSDGDNYETESSEEEYPSKQPAYENIVEPQVLHSVDTHDEIETPEFEEAKAPEQVLEENDQLVVCGYCEADNDQQAFICISCKTVLTLSDIEMLLSQKDADTESIQNALDKLEADKETIGVSNEELKLLGIGYINLKEYRKGFDFLREASQNEPNDVMLGSQIDSLAIRIAEIEIQEKDFDAQPKSKTILIVDDSPTVRKLISGKLEKCGHEAICAVDGMDALAKINEIIPDLILLDITMPRMDGYQVCKLIRGNEATREVPVVMISGKDGFFDKVRGRMAGTDNYITKPFGPETLMMTVNQYIS